MPDLTEISNNGTSVLVKVVSYYLSQLNVPMEIVKVKSKKNQNHVLLCILNVTTKVSLLDSVKILHSLISTMKLNLSKFQKV